VRRSLFAATLALAAGGAAAETLPLIALTPAGDGLELVASVSGAAGEAVTGTLTVTRTSRGNRMTTSQSATVTIPGAGRADIARLAVNAPRPTDLEAQLTLTRDAREIGQTRLTLTLP
jgi:hypothetical protein